MKATHHVELAAKPFRVIDRGSGCRSEEQTAIPERYINGDWKLLLYSQITYPLSQRKRVVFIKRRENQRLLLSDDLLDIVTLRHDQFSPLSTSRKSGNRFSHNDMLKIKFKAQRALNSM